MYCFRRTMEYRQSAGRGRLTFGSWVLKRVRRIQNILKRNSDAFKHNIRLEKVHGGEFGHLKTRLLLAATSCDDGGGK